MKSRVASVAMKVAHHVSASNASILFALLTQQYVWPHGVTTGLCNVRQHNTQSKSDCSIFDGLTCKSVGFGSIANSREESCNFQLR